MWTLGGCVGGESGGCFCRGFNANVVEPQAAHPHAANKPTRADVNLYTFVQGFIPRRILCTGFSLGGGLATVAALWAALTVPTADVRCVTFGAPRVGNSDFADAFVNTVGAQYRVVYEADPTPHHPRPVFYSHASHPIWIHEGKFLFHVRPAPPWPHASGPRGGGRRLPQLISVDFVRTWCCAMRHGPCPMNRSALALPRPTASGRQARTADHTQRSQHGRCLL